MWMAMVLFSVLINWSGVSGGREASLEMIRAGAVEARGNGLTLGLSVKLNKMYG